MADVEFKLNDFRIHVLDGPYLAADTPTADARQFAATIVNQLEQMRMLAAQSLLKNYNDNWREDDEPILNDREFSAMLTNPHITLYDEIGSAVVLFDDSNMFAGHWIQVSFDDGEFAAASIVG